MKIRNNVEYSDYNEYPQNIAIQKVCEKEEDDYQFTSDSTEVTRYDPDTKSDQMCRYDENTKLDEVCRYDGNTGADDIRRFPSLEELIIDFQFCLPYSLTSSNCKDLAKFLSSEELVIRC